MLTSQTRLDRENFEDPVKKETVLRRRSLNKNSANYHKLHMTNYNKDANSWMPLSATSSEVRFF